MTVERSRVLAWEGCLNARDLGGYPTEDGGETRWDRIVRSDDLAQLTPSGRSALLEHGIRTIVDLRLPDELETYPPPFRGHPEVRYHNVSFIDPAVAADPYQPQGLIEDYLDMLEKFRESVGSVMTTIAGAPDGGVLFHCHAGKDRTGLIAALLLRLAGVPIPTVAEDYGLTSTLLRTSDEEWLASGPGERDDREREYEIWRARDEVMEAVLNRLEARHGSVERYLLDAGVSSADIAALRDRLLC